MLEKKEKNVEVPFDIWAFFWVCVFLFTCVFHFLVIYQNSLIRNRWPQKPETGVYNTLLFMGKKCA